MKKININLRHFKIQCEILIESNYGIFFGVTIRLNYSLIHTQKFDI